MKSVQRGCTSFYQAEVNGPNAHITKNINISNVNVNKSILLLETNIIGQDVVNSNARGHKYAVTLNSTSIIFDFYYTVNNDVEFIVPLFFWQVVEFY